MPFLEESSAVALRKPELSFYSNTRAAGVMESQVRVFICPSRRTSPQIGKPEERNGVSRAGALADYAICGGDGLCGSTCVESGGKWRYFSYGPGKSNGI